MMSRFACRGGMPISTLKFSVITFCGLTRDCKLYGAVLKTFTGERIYQKEIVLKLVNYSFDINSRKVFGQKGTLGFRNIDRIWVNCGGHCLWLQMAF